MESDSPDNERGLEEKEPVLADSEQATCLCLQFILRYKIYIYIWMSVVREFSVN